MQTRAGTKNNVQRPQKGSLVEVSVRDFTKWFDNKPVWPSWLEKRELLLNTCVQAGRVTLLQALPKQEGNPGTRTFLPIFN